MNVTILRGAEVTDRYNDTAVDWSNPERIPWRGVSLAPAGSREVTSGNRAAAIAEVDAYGPNIDLRATDRVEVAPGEVYTVEGPPAVWRRRSGAVAGIVANLKRVAG